MDEGYVFDNILIANDPAAAAAKRDALWAPKKDAEVRAQGCCKPCWSTCPGSVPGAHSGSPGSWPHNTADVVPCMSKPPLG